MSLDLSQFDPRDCADCDQTVSVLASFHGVTVCRDCQTQRDADAYTLTFDLAGGPLTVRYDGPRNTVGWCSDWARIDEAHRAGYLRRSFGGAGTFGHVDFHVDQIRADAAV